MIICPTQKFVFVHIPKCAGTSIRTQIVKCDPEHISLGRVSRHPELGPIDYGHIPLPLLRSHFPKYYAYLEWFPSFAIVRDPLPRFGSALRQILWQYDRTPMTLIPKDVLRRRVNEILKEVEAEIDTPSHRFIFFARQKSFLDEGDRRIVTHVVPLEMVGEFIAHLARQTGVDMEPETRANQNVDLRFKQVGALAYKINGFLRERLPIDLHERLKRNALKILATRQSAAEAMGVLDLPEVRDFVAHTYAEDAEIYREAISGRKALAMTLSDVTLPGSA